MDIEDMDIGGGYVCNLYIGCIEIHCDQTVGNLAFCV